jgi:hypothetical protein
MLAADEFALLPAFFVLIGIILEAMLCGGSSGVNDENGEFHS